MAVTPYAMSHELHGCYREAMQKLTFDQPPCFITKGTAASALLFAFNNKLAVICHSLTHTHIHMQQHPCTHATCMDVSR